MKQEIETCHLYKVQKISKAWIKDCQLLANNPKHLANATPGKIQDCQLHQGQYGVNGSIIEWKYTVDGKAQSAKKMLEGINKEKKTISWKILEGDLSELYNNMIVSVHVETKDGIDHITWTLDYELIAPENPHPLSHLNFFICFTKELEAHIFG